MTPPNNNQENVIVCHHPRGVAGRKARRGYRIVNFDDRSPEYRASSMDWSCHDGLMQNQRWQSA